MDVIRLTPDEWLRWHCPGCECSHRVPIKAMNGWQWNGSLESPTLSPSVLVHGHQTLNAAGEALVNAGRGDELTDEHRATTPTCHTFIRDGRIEFLADCTHALAGQTVPMVEVE